MSDAQRRVVIAGDVAESFRPRYGRPVQVEHWFNAHEQALTVAANILAPDGGLAAHDTVPYFWSEQHGTHLQVLGRPDSAVIPVRVDLTRPKPGTLYLYAGPGAELAATVSLNAPARLMRLRPLIAAAAPLTDALRLLEASGATLGQRRLSMIPKDRRHI